MLVKIDSEIFENEWFREKLATMDCPSGRLWVVWPMGLNLGVIGFQIQTIFEEWASNKKFRNHRIEVE